VVVWNPAGSGELRSLSCFEQVFVCYSTLGGARTRTD